MSTTSSQFIPPKCYNEPYLLYPPGSDERSKLDSAIQKAKDSLPFTVPVVIGGREYETGSMTDQIRPDAIQAPPLCRSHNASPELVAEAIDGALKAQRKWAETPWHERATVFLRAAELICGKYRWQLMAATMLGQGKNVWQAEGDCIAELADFCRFAVKIVDEGYKQQPSTVVQDAINRLEFRPLEGFTLAVSPFNFTAIGGNLALVPAILGNVVLWKPSPMAMYANYLTHKIFLEAGVPGDVIQFVPGDAPSIVDQAINHRDFAALHFTGSTQILRSIWQKIGNNIHKYRSYPRIIGETGGKNFHLVHPSCDIEETVIQAIRAGFEYQGQKCSALGRLYIPRSLYEKGWLDRFVSQTETIKQGQVDKYESFMGPVINEASYDRIMAIIEEAQNEGGTILSGGTGDKTEGYYIKPTIIETQDPRSITMVKEIFGPIVTVYVYDDSDWNKILDIIDTTSEYALTGAIFSNDRQDLNAACETLRYSAGNIYLNERTPGAIVGQHPFGGNRASGTNDKSGTWAHFSRFVSPRCIKDNFAAAPAQYWHPSNLS